MSIIDQLKAEIERLKGICTTQIKANPGQTFPFVMEMTGYDKLLTFLDTLEEEPVELEKEIDMYFKDWDTNSNGAFFNEEGYKIDTIALKNIARHFYNLGQQNNSNPERKLRKVSTWVSDTERELKLEKEVEKAGKDVLLQANKHNKRFDIPQNIFDDVQLMDIFKSGVYKGIELGRGSSEKPNDHFREPTKMVEKSEIPTNLDFVAQFYAENHSRCQEEADAFKAGAMWDREQGRTFEEDFDGHRPINLTLDKYVLQSIGVHSHCKVIIQIRKKDE